MARPRKEEKRARKRAKNALKRMAELGEKQFERASEFADAGYEVSPEEYASYLDPIRGLSNTEVHRGLLGESELAGARADQFDIDAQRRTLAGLEGMASGQPTEGDLAAQNMLRMQRSEQARGERGALRNRFAAQGMGGSGAELAAQLSGQQGGMNAMALQQGMLDQERSRRALAAMQAAGSQAGQMRGQSFEEAATRAQAADIFNMDNMNWKRDAITGTRDIENMKAGAIAEQANRQFNQRLGSEAMVAGATDTAIGANAPALDWAKFSADRADKQGKMISKAVGGPLG